jgi:hypothetical protein
MLATTNAPVSLVNANSHDRLNAFGEKYESRTNDRLLALRTRRAYDNNLPFLDAFQSSKGELMVAPLKCGLRVRRSPA